MKTTNNNKKLRGAPLFNKLIIGSYLPLGLIKILNNINWNSQTFYQVGP